MSVVGWGVLGVLGGCICGRLIGPTVFLLIDYIQRRRRPVRHGEGQ